MIDQIFLKGIATYHTGATLHTDKKINLIYGLNGAGKSTLSKYLYNIQNPNYAQCSINTPDGLDEYEFLVYNTDFVEDNFYEIDAQQGIFTLSKENKDAMLAVNKLEAEIDSYASKETDVQESIIEVQNSQKQSLQNIQNKVWESKHKYFDNDPIIQDIVGKGTGKNIANYYSSVYTAEDDPNCKSVELIRAEYNALSQNQSKISILGYSLYSLEEYETNPLLQKQVVGNSNSSISEVINKLKNADWVKTGRSFLQLLNNERCPFCQRSGLNHSFAEELEQYFDNSYKEDLAKLQKLYSDYSSKVDAYFFFENVLEGFFKAYPFLAESYKTQREATCEKLHRILSLNKQLLQNKNKEPSIPISLQPSSAAFVELKLLISALNDKIKEFNAKVDNVEIEKTFLKKEFWKAIRKEYKSEINLYIDHSSRYTDHLNKLNQSLKDVLDHKELLKKELIEKRAQVINIDDAIESINGMLSNVGLGHIIFDKYFKDGVAEPLYKLKRKGEEDTVFKSFSEGEKMMASFLYFIEKCKGASSKDSQKKKKIIVIDDPISSMSHIFVYNVALLINKEFISWNRLNNKNEHGADGYPYPYDQVFILTHNLYFYYELAERDGKRRNTFQKLFRIQKKNNDSSIVELKYNEIHNDYQAYWTIIKNARESDHPLLANCMRNILEYFFVFTENLDLHSVFSKTELNSIDFQSFYRYINRESHSVGQNACDTKEFDYDQLLELFKNVFKATHYETHYDTMMQIG